MTEKQKQTLRNVFAVGAVLVGILLVLLLAVLAATFSETNLSEPAYVSRLFDDSRVHTIDLQVADWDAFLANAPPGDLYPLYRRD